MDPVSGTAQGADPSHRSNRKTAALVIHPPQAAPDLAACLEQPALPVGLAGAPRKESRVPPMGWRVGSIYRSKTCSGGIGLEPRASTASHPLVDLFPKYRPFRNTRT